FFVSSVCRAPIFILFPYTTLFRSSRQKIGDRLRLYVCVLLESRARLVDVDLDADVFERQHLVEFVREYRPDLGELVRVVRRKHADRKSTRLNSSHVSISYAVFCLK